MSYKVLDNIPFINSFNNNEYIYFKNGGLAKYMKKYNIKMYDEPNECVLIKNNNDTFDLKIIEYKDYTDTYDDYDYELKTGKFKIDEYKLMFNNININISLCFVISKRFEDKLNTNKQRYNILKTILDENNIKLFNEYCSNLYIKLHNWIYL
jgi:hypothetical protein